MKKIQIRVALLAFSVFVFSGLTFAAAAKEADEPSAEMDFFRFDRWVGDEVIESGTRLFELKKGVQTFNIPSETGGELTFLVFYSEFPSEHLDLFGDDYWYKISSPGGASVFAKKTADDERWFLATGVVGVMVESPFRPSDTIEYDFFIKRNGEWDNVSWIEIGGGDCSVFGLNDQQFALFIPPGAHIEEAPEEWLSFTWLLIADTPETGIVYVFPHFIGEEWMLKSCGKEFYATATEVDPSVDPANPWNRKVLAGGEGG